MLLETLVALTILCFAMTGVFAAMSVSYRAASNVRIHQVALAFTRSHLDTIGRERPIQAGSYSGSYGNGMLWRLNVQILGADANASETSALPYWLSLETFDRRGALLLRLETVKLGTGPS
jgi:type II secretory pathway pseudopilin PulG